MLPTLHALLLDFDGLLATYDHRVHLHRLADAAGCTPAQVDAARGRALQAGRRYPNLVDNMWAARHVPRGDEAATRDADDAG